MLSFYNATNISMAFMHLCDVPFYSTNKYLYDLRYAVWCAFLEYKLSSSIPEESSTYLVICCNNNNSNNSNSSTAIAAASDGSNDDDKFCFLFGYAPTSRRQSASLFNMENTDVSKTRATLNSLAIASEPIEASTHPVGMGHPNHHSCLERTSC